MKLFNNNLFKLFSLQANFYMPIVTVPLILSILGFRSSSRAVILGMISGALCAIIWTLYIKPVTGVDSVIPAMISNLVVLMSTHYLLRESGGWVGIKDKSDLKKTILSSQNSRINVKKFFRYLYQTT